MTMHGVNHVETHMPPQGDASPSSKVFGNEDLLRRTLLFSVSSADFKALVKACIRPGARGGYAPLYRQYLLSDIGLNVSVMVKTMLRIEVRSMLWSPPGGSSRANIT